MKEFRALFKADKEKLSYYNFFQFVQHKLEIELQDWEEDALEMRLDRLGMAFIEFNELNEFSRDYGLDWREPIDENDLEEQLDRKINLSYKDYEVDEKDYFEGCKSMFNNEKAALRVASDIYRKLRREKQDYFVDTDFGPKDKADK